MNNVCSLLTEPTHSCVEVGFWWAQIALVFVAIGGAALTIWQLVLIKRQAKATFLFELDRMWESKEFSDARAKFHTLRKEAEDSIAADQPYKDKASQEEAILDQISAKLFTLKESKTLEYLELIKLCGFFETAGMLIDRGYVRFKDIKGLWGGSIMRLYMTFHKHINKRQEDLPPGYLEYFLTLGREIVKRSPWYKRIFRPLPSTR